MKHDERPFASQEEHDTFITQNFSGIGGPGKTLWLLGDIARRQKDLTAFLEKVLPAWGNRVHLIRGDMDDKVAWKLRDFFASAREAHYLRIRPGASVYLSHYPHRTWRNAHKGSYHLHGHGNLRGECPSAGRSYDVGVTLNAYVPIQFEVIERMLEVKDVNKR